MILPWKNLHRFAAKFLRQPLYALKWGIGVCKPWFVIIGPAEKQLSGKFYLFFDPSL